MAKTREDQGCDTFETPPIDSIPEISRLHVAAMEASNDEAIWVAARMKHLLLRTIGRRSGGEHKVALPYWRDEAGHRIVAASFAGSPRHPAWFQNLRDRAANPSVRVQERERIWWTVPEVLEGAEHAWVWAQMIVDRPYYQTYQATCPRQIPLIRLRETTDTEEPR